MAVTAAHEPRMAVPPADRAREGGKVRASEGGRRARPHPTARVVHSAASFVHERRPRGFLEHLSGPSRRRESGTLDSIHAQCPSPSCPMPRLLSLSRSPKSHEPSSLSTAGAEYAALERLGLYAEGGRGWAARNRSYLSTSGVRPDVGHAARIQGCCSKSLALGPATCTRAQTANQWWRAQMR